MAPHLNALQQPAEGMLPARWAFLAPFLGGLCSFVRHTWVVLISYVTLYSHILSNAQCMAPYERDQVCLCRSLPHFVLLEHSTAKWIFSHFHNCIFANENIEINILYLDLMFAPGLICCRLVHYDSLCSQRILFSSYYPVYTTNLCPKYVLLEAAIAEQ